MPSPSRAYPVAFERLTTPFARRLGSVAIISILAALAEGCSAPPPLPVAGRDPSDPSAHTAPVRYRSTIAPYTSRRPADPVPWREQNEHVAPSAKPET
jgi:hypothetical protein